MKKDIQERLEKEIAKYTEACIDRAFETKVSGKFDKAIKRFRNFVTQAITLSVEAKEKEKQDYKNNVVKYAIDTLENDLLQCGLSEREASILERLRYWMLEKEVRFGERGEKLPLSPKKEEK